MCPRLSSEAGEVSASYADGGFSALTGAFAGTSSPSRNPRRGGARESMPPGCRRSAQRAGSPLFLSSIAAHCLSLASGTSGKPP